MYDMMPYPDGCGREDAGCLKLPLFGKPMPPPRPPACPQRDCRCPQPQCRQSVTLCSPCNPWECATIDLSVDECGNLVLCVRRDGPTPRPQPRRRCRC